VPNQSAGMRWPEMGDRSPDAVEGFLVRRAVHVIVNLTAAPYASSVLSERFEVLHIPVANMTAPSVEQMDSVWSTTRRCHRGR
jgi:hypothetical protein